MSRKVHVSDAMTYEDGSLFHDGKGRAVPLPQALAPLADSHGHLTHFHAHKAAEALARAAVAGVRLLVVPIDPTGDGRDAQEVLDRISRWQEEAYVELEQLKERCGLEPPSWPDCQVAGRGLESPLAVRIVAGAHPYGAPVLDEDALAQLDVLLDDARCVGVGEIGLDVGPWNKAPLDAQEEAFRRQLRIAHERELPVELHLRDEGDERTTAHDLAYRVLEEEGVPAAGCDLHCFTSGPEVMEPFVGMGCHIAFGGAATFPRSTDILAAAVACPQGRLLVETDSPYMAPVPLRGQECEPAMVALSAAFVAEAREAAGVATRRETYEALWDTSLKFFALA